MRIRPLFTVLVVASSLLGLSSRTVAQSVFGTVLGTVTDASGAVVPHIVVTITNQGENTSHEVRTDAQGNYLAENMKAGIYTVSAKVPGFREMALTDVRLDARQTVRADLKLTMGSVEEKVTVEDHAELVNTETPDITSNITSTEVLNLPANYRGAGSTSPYALLAFLPGVTGDKFG